MSQIRVAVTGVTGFIGAQVAHDLLDRDYIVHALLRRNTSERTAHLTSHPKASSNLHIFEVDLSSVQSILPALQNVIYVVHIASPFIMNVKDAQKELVDPAVNMTKAVLQACNETAVKKVVLTSSIAAIAGMGTNGVAVDESVWNQHSSLKRAPYFYSKTCAERAAWDFVKDKELDLVILNPPLVLGPSLIPTISESHSMLIKVAEGELLGIVNLEMATVDVRDVSEAHIRAMEDGNASGRYICCGENANVHIRDFTNIALECGLKPPTRDLTSNFFSRFIMAASHLIPGGAAGEYARNHIGNPIHINSNKIRKELRIEFRNVLETCKETYEDLLKWGHLELPSA